MNLYSRIAGRALAMCLSVPSVFAQTVASTASPRVALEAATVYLRGAQLNGTVTIDLPAGR